MAQELVSDPGLFLQRAAPGLAGLGMSVPLSSIAAAVAGTGRVGAGVLGVGSTTPSAVSLGQAGEQAVGIPLNAPKLAIRIPESTTIRYPDVLTATTIGEVKNVARLSLTQQIQDYIAFAQSTGRTFNLYVRPTTTLTGPLQETIGSGQTNLNFIPPVP